MMRILIGLLIATTVSVTSVGRDVSRYPSRLPDWIWDVDSTSHLLEPAVVLSLRQDAIKSRELAKLKDETQADAVNDSLSVSLGSKFAPRDLAEGAMRVRNAKTGIDLAVRIDPAFTPEVQAVIGRAVERFATVGLDRKLISTTFERSAANPTPFPPMYDSSPETSSPDEAGRKPFSAGYSFYLRQRRLPENANQLAARLQDALQARGGEPAILIISSYSDDVWWGYSYYRYFDNPLRQLTRESPARGYLYFALNVDKFVAPSEGWNDPDFWASKVAHEILHNLGYWHPPYTDAKERDDNNSGRSWALPVSYEFAVRERLSRK